VSTFTTPAVSEAGKAVALAVVLSVLVAYVPLLALFAIPALPLPLGYLTLRRGVGVGVAGAVCVAALAAAVTGLSNGLLALLVAGFLGVVLGVALRAHRGFSWTLIVTALGATSALVAWIASVWVVTGMSRAQLSKLVDDSMAAAGQLYTSMGMSQASIDLASKQIHETLRMIPYLAPAIAGVGGVILASAVLGLAAAVYPHVGEKAIGHLAFSRFRLHWGAAYGYIGGLALLVLASRFGTYHEVARLVGLNLLVFFQTLFFLQGLALAHWFVVSRRMSAGRRAVVYGAALLGQTMFQLTSWAGLLDTWFDYRKRFPPRDADKGPAAPVGPRMNDHEEN
jgi:uncharacterized protein YybS (DUF2232 family)